MIIKPVGRPTTYKEENPQLLLELMETGTKTVSQISAYFGITPMTFYAWKEEYPEFNEAYELGLPKAQAFWERVGINAIIENTPKFNSSLYIFNMCNWFRQDYHQKNSESTVNVNLTQNTLNLEKMSDDELDKLMVKKNIKMLEKPDA